jgi:hypothetical protein
MRSKKLQFLNEDGRTEMYERYKKNIFYISFPNSPKQSQIECILLVFGVTERQSDCNVECVTVQHIECTDSVQCAAELY